jgi:tryptophan synthase alpha chain
VKCIRRESPVPLILFSYFNPILQYGLDALARDSRNAGVDGLLVTDITPEEGGEYCECLERSGLDSVFLVAPTSSPERISRICDCSRGFVYVVSRTGVTGARRDLAGTLATTIGRVREKTDLPVAVGFGISNPAQVRNVGAMADGAVVGSAIVEQIEQERTASDLVLRIGSFCRWLTEGADG